MKARVEWRWSWAASGQARRGGEGGERLKEALTGGPHLAMREREGDMGWAGAVFFHDAYTLFIDVLDFLNDAQIC